MLNYFELEMVCCKKSHNQETGFGIIHMIITFRCPLLPKPVSWSGLFFSFLKKTGFRLVEIKPSEIQNQGFEILKGVQNF